MISVFGKGFASIRSMNKLKILIIILISIISINIIFNIIENQKEKNVLGKILDNYNKNISTHSEINSFKHFIIDNYINIPKSKFQMNLWSNHRGFLRQTALETLNGKSAVCGELSRVLIKLLRKHSIKSRRLYVYEGDGTSHVMLEYFDKSTKRWIALNSFKSTDYLESITQNKQTILELFNNANAVKLVYFNYSNLNYPLTKIFGYKYNIPYVFSYLMDEVYIIKVIFNLFLLLILILILRKII
jgi:hypothetical protein